MVGSSSDLSPSRGDGERSTNRFLGAVFLTGVAGAGLVAGFGMTLASTRKNNSHWFDKGLHGPEAGTRLAFRALGLGSLLAVIGVASISFATCCALGIHSLSDLRRNFKLSFCWGATVPLMLCPHSSTLELISPTSER
uniref:Transmembrane protein 242 n=1 Tax=Eptatretus burgeri TaxID=7764 RepID=A0A8C4WSK6_EPTBU